MHYISTTHAQIDCQDDLLEKLRLKDFYKTQCLPYIGDNPSKQIELTYSSWVQELPGPHDISPDTYLQELVMGPAVDLTTDLFQLYKDHEYAKMLDLKHLPQPSLPASADAEASSPKSSSEREDGYIDVDDSYPNSDRRSKKKKKKRR
ncbi:hypothetical protein L0F63_005504 [Massospora cicadina]|nr:hypothetical protein L0F63_005504 [Massospora cicadina]